MSSGKKFFFFLSKSIFIGKFKALRTRRRHKAVNFEEAVKLYLYLFLFYVVKMVNFSNSLYRGGVLNVT